VITVSLPLAFIKIDGATVVKWHFVGGDRFSEGDILCDIVTHETMMGVPSGGPGEIIEICADVGAMVGAGAILCRIHLL